MKMMMTKYFIVNLTTPVRPAADLNWQNRQQTGGGEVGGNVFFVHITSIII